MLSQTLIRANALQKNSAQKVISDSSIVNGLRCARRLRPGSCTGTNSLRPNVSASIEPPARQKTCTMMAKTAPWFAPYGLIKIENQYENTAHGLRSLTNKNAFYCRAVSNHS